MVKNQKGFTLIELLIVIVIIGILAGVLIAIIDPTSQQNRARDATLQATINKMALAVGGYRSAYGVNPDAFQFRSLVTGVNPTPATSCANAGAECLFTLTNGLLPSTCNSAGTWYGNGITSGGGADNTPCTYRYQDLGTTFNIWGKSFGINNGVFRYNSTDSRLYLCTVTTSGGAPANGCGTAI